MSSSSVLSQIIKKTKEAVKNFVPVQGQSVMRQIANVGANEAGITSTKVSNGTFNGYKGAFFEVQTPTIKEVHCFVKQSALLVYFITRTNPSNVQEKATHETVYTVQMPEKNYGDGWNVDGGDGASSSKQK